MSNARFTSEANIVFGGLVTFWGILTEAYMLFFHSSAGVCASNVWPVGAFCIPAVAIPILPLVVGMGFMIHGAATRPIPSQADDLLRTDPFTLAALACFFSAAFVSGVALASELVKSLAYGEPPASVVIGANTFTTIGTLSFTTILFTVFATVGFMVNWSHVRRRQRFMRGYQRAVARHRSRA